MIYIGKRYRSINTKANHFIHRSKNNHCIRATLNPCPPPCFATCFTCPPLTLCFVCPMVLPMAMASQGALMGRTGQGCENPFPHLRALLPLFVRATNLKIMYSLLRARIEIMYTWCGLLTIRFSMCREITMIKSESQRESRERERD